MKTLTLVALAVATASLASLTTGCLIGGGCETADNSYRTPVTFDASTTLAFRTPSTCGVMNPAYTASDTFALELTGDRTVAVPTTLTVDVTATVAVNQAVPLNVTATGNAATGTSDDGTIQFSFSAGSDAAALDATPLDSVMVTVTALPDADGQPLAAELHLTFQDGRALDQTYMAPVQSAFVQCSTVSGSSSWVR
jgi:hypothetical protein